MNKDKEFFIENLAMLIDSGIDILNALKSLEREVRSKSMKKTIATIIVDIDAGLTLSQAMDKTRMLPSANIALIKIGERSGQLVENLNLIAAQNQKDRSFRSKIKSAMMYPVMVLAVMCVVGISIAWFILPKLATVFVQLKLKLPWITEILIQFGIFLGKYGTIAVPSFLIGLFLIIYFTFIYDKTKFIGEHILFALPFLKKLIQEVEIARFGYLLGTLLDVGIPIIESLDSIVASPSFQAYGKLYTYLRDNIQKGITFKKSFETYKNSEKLIPHFVQQIIMAGEYSGNLSKALKKIGVIYEEKTEMNAKNLTVILEPILLIVIACGVLGVAIAVILPIYSLVGGMNNNI
jgi:type IV pilus assembly protein PilC